MRTITSHSVIASIMGRGVVATSRVAGNVADHSCWGCSRNVAGVAGNIGTGCARDLSIVKNIQMAREMLA